MEREFQAREKELQAQESEKERRFETENREKRMFELEKLKLAKEQQEYRTEHGKGKNESRFVEITKSA